MLSGRSVLLACLVATACSGSSPTAPRGESALAPAIATSSGQPSPFGVVVADLAACLRVGRDPACFSAMRVTARGGLAAAAPTSPIGLVATVIGSAVTLNWNAPASGDPVTTYVLEAGSSSGAADLANFSTGSTALSYGATGVGAGVYYVRVRAQNAGGTSAASNEVVVTVVATSCTSPPNPPTGLAATTSGNTVTLRWTAPSGGCAPSSYVLQAGSSAGGTNLANLNTGSAATSYVAVSVPNGIYYLRVLAQNAGGRSAASNEIAALVAPNKVTFAFEGVIGLSCFVCGAGSSSFGTGVAPGTRLTGTYTFDRTTPPTSSAQPNRLYYYGVIVEFTVGSESVTGNDASQARIEIANGPPQGDSYSLIALGGFRSGTIAGRSIDQFTWVVSGSSSLFSDTSLPPTPAVFSRERFTGQSTRICIGACFAGAILEGSIDALTPAP
jgi:hypothetical protein